MMLRSLLALFALLVVNVRHGNAANEDGPISYGCDEVVVIGRVQTVNYADLTSADDLLGSGRYDVRVSIKRVLRGKEGRRVVPAHVLSHGQMREDIDFWLVLTPEPEGGYVIRSGNLTSAPYRLASRCR